MRGQIWKVLALGAAALLAACETHTHPSAPQMAAPEPSPQIVGPPTTTGDLGIIMPDNFSNWLRGHYTERVLVFNGYEPLNGQGVAFVGDSITEGGDWAAAFPGVETRNYGIGGDTTFGLERRINQIVNSRPAKIFLLIGTNDLGNHNSPPAEIVANYDKVLDRFAAELPDTRVYMQAVLPREPRNAAAVREINDGLRALAAQRGLIFIDIYTPFAVEGGRLDPTVTEDDLHLTPAGYERWRGIIDPLVRGQG